VLSFGSPIDPANPRQLDTNDFRLERLLLDAAANYRTVRVLISHNVIPIPVIVAGIVLAPWELLAVAILYAQRVDLPARHDRYPGAGRHSAPTRCSGGVAETWPALLPDRSRCNPHRRQRATVDATYSAARRQLRRVARESKRTRHGA
jgi:hypothetical protein